MEILRGVDMDTMWARSSSTLDIRDQLNSLFYENDPNKDVLFIDKERLLRGRPVVISDRGINSIAMEKKTINDAVNAIRVNVTRYGKNIAKNHAIQIRKHSEDGIFTGVFVKFVSKEDKQ
tara:strand:- start:4898 stop:5257 length:360 start_codon:yes stop_codon:yes gene_type:complete